MVLTAGFLDAAKLQELCGTHEQDDLAEIEESMTYSRIRNWKAVEFIEKYALMCNLNHALYPAAEKQKY